MAHVNLLSVIPELGGKAGLPDSLQIRSLREYGTHLELLLRDPDAATLYVADLQRSSASDRRILALIDRWSAVRSRNADTRCYALLAAERIEPRQRNILRLIARAVPLLAMELRSDSETGRVAITPLPLR